MNRFQRRLAERSRKPMRTEHQRDRGSVLPLILALMVIGSLAVVALLTFATTLFVNRPPIETRDRTFWSAKSAMSMAMVLQTAHGPNDCYKSTDSFQLNGFTANAWCTPGAYFGTGRGRFAVITTANDPTSVRLTGRGPAAVAKPIEGRVFVNSGRFDDTAADITVNGTLFDSSYASLQSDVNRYVDYTTVPAVPAASSCANPNVQLQIKSPNSGVECRAEAWWQFAGNQADTSAVTNPRDYPVLPPLPPYTRPNVPQATVGTCNVFFPGQYPDPVTFPAGQYYFASGIYYFSNTVTLQPGASIVAGEGLYSGCTVDAEAAFAGTAPAAHNITGKGATFLFGGAGKLVATDASLRMNVRVSDPNTRGSETISIRSVNFTTTPPTGPTPVEIPNDAVVLADAFSSTAPCNSLLSTTKCLQYASDHTSKASSTASEKRYSSSTLGINDNIIEYNQTGGSASSNQLVADGYVFVPNAKITLNGGANTNYRLNLTGGVVASAVDFGYDAMPSTASNWYVGVREQRRQQQFGLYTSVTAPNGQRSVSRATLSVHQDGSYAINNWTVDPNAGGVEPTTTTTTTTTLPPTTTTTTLPPTTTTTTLPPTTTTTTTTTTTLPPTTTTVPPSGPCNTSSGTWTRNFGPGSWTAQFWKLTDWGGGVPSNPFPGAPTVTKPLSEINAYLPNSAAGTPDPLLNQNYFSTRIERTINVTTGCTVSFRAGGDDGYRVYIDGVLRTDLANWAVHAHSSKTASVNLSAGPHTILFEFFEYAGQASYDLEWKS